MNKTLNRALVALLPAAVLLAGCAGVGSNYSTPAPKQQISFDLVAITPEVAAENRREVPTSDEASIASHAADKYVYMIGPGDILSVFIVGLDPSREATRGQGSEAETQYLVSETGDIYLPLHGRLNVAELTISQAYERIYEALSRFINSPQINVRVAEFRSQRVTVVGAVGQPGFVPITDRPMSITELMVVAGAKENSDLRKVVLKRYGSQRIVDVASLMNSPQFGEKWVLRDKDVVVVPSNENKIYVVGEAPNRVELIDPFNNSLADVLVGGGQAGGGGSYLQAGSAKPSHVFVVRPVANRAVVYHLDASRAESFLVANQFQLSSGDVVYVATRRITRYNRFLSQILPTLQSLIAPTLLIDQFGN